MASRLILISLLNIGLVLPKHLNGGTYNDACPTPDKMVPSPCTDECVTDDDCMAPAVCCPGGCKREALDRATKSKYHTACIYPDICRPELCKNGGVCVRDGEEGYDCLCPQGFTGPACEIDIDDCASAPCKNGGICEDLANDYQCCCPAKLAGKNCDQESKCSQNMEINHCKRATCSKFPEAICIDMPRFFLLSGSTPKDVTDQCAKP